MYAVAGVTGNTGSVVAETLLSQGLPVRAIVRNEEKGRPWREKGAEIALADLSDAAALEQAIAGAEGLYYLVPPDMTSPDVLDRGRRLIDTLEGALKRTDVLHVVFLSSIGAHQPTGTGPIRILHYGEQVLRTLPIRSTFIRAGSFMENTEPLIPVMRDHAILPSFFEIEKKVPMVATKDIGETAAHALVEQPASQVIELAGPGDYSLADVATAFSKAFGKQVTAVNVAPEAAIPTLLQAGVSQNAAELILEMYQGIDHGLVSYEGGSAQFQRGRVTLEEFASQSAAQFRQPAAA